MLGLPDLNLKSSEAWADTGSVSLKVFLHEVKNASKKAIVNASFGLKGFMVVRLKFKYNGFNFLITRLV